MLARYRLLILKLFSVVCVSVSLVSLIKCAMESSKPTSCQGQSVRDLSPGPLHSDGEDSPTGSPLQFVPDENTAVLYLWHAAKRRKVAMAPRQPRAEDGEDFVDAVAKAINSTDMSLIARRETDGDDLLLGVTNEQPKTKRPRLRKESPTVESPSHDDFYVESQAIGRKHNVRLQLLHDPAPKSKDRLLDADDALLNSDCRFHVPPTPPYSLKRAIGGQAETSLRRLSSSKLATGRRMSHQSRSLPCLRLDKWSGYRPPPPSPEPLEYKGIKIECPFLSGIRHKECPSLASLADAINRH